MKAAFPAPDEPRIKRISLPLDFVFAPFPPKGSDQKRAQKGRVLPRPRPVLLLRRRDFGSKRHRSRSHRSPLEYGEREQGRGRRWGRQMKAETSWRPRTTTLGALNTTARERQGEKREIARVPFVFAEQKGKGCLFVFPPRLDCERAVSLMISTERRKGSDGKVCQVTPKMPCASRSLKVRLARHRGPSARWPHTPFCRPSMACRCQ